MVNAVDTRGVDDTARRIPALYLAMETSACDRELQKEGTRSGTVACMRDDGNAVTVINPDRRLKCRAWRSYGCARTDDWPRRATMRYMGLEHRS